MTEPTLEAVGGTGANSARTRREMIESLRKRISSLLHPNRITIEWIYKEQNTWLSKNIITSFIQPPRAPNAEKILRLADQADQLGPQPLWEGYYNLKKYPDPVKNAYPTANQVCISSFMGDFFAYLVKIKRPSVIVEFGTAFGVSGMYFLSGLESNNYGELLTFEPNERWAEIARKNLSTIGDRFQLIIGTFEGNIDLSLGNDRQIDIAFIDAIHTSEFLWPQYNLVVERLKPNGIILIDDVNFSSDMSSCWNRIAQDYKVKASAILSDRVGIVECN